MQFTSLSLLWLSAAALHFMYHVKEFKLSQRYSLALIHCIVVSLVFLVICINLV